jgi:pyruvate kinase
MNNAARRTKIVATIGPASRSPVVLRELIRAGMDVARLNFSHGSYEDHARIIDSIRALSIELDTPVTILQDLQGPKVRVGRLSSGSVRLAPGDTVDLVPEAAHAGEPSAIPIDYPDAGRDASAGMKVLLADGLIELSVVSVEGQAVCCRVVEGGVLESRKGVNFPDISLRLPSLTAKDLSDLEFGLSKNVDWVSLSFVRSAEDVRSLKRVLASKGADNPVVAKIEKPQAVAHLEEILDEVDGLMVARGDLGVEMSPEQVPMIQKRIIELCNRRGKPVITATQMLESMIHEPRPTRAEASDVANAIIDGTDAVMLSGESAVGDYPVRAVEMMARIAREVESRTSFKSYPPADRTGAHALSEAAHVMEDLLSPGCIVVASGDYGTARLIAAERPKTPVVVLTALESSYHVLNLIWGIRPVLVDALPSEFAAQVSAAREVVARRRLADGGDRLLVVGSLQGESAGVANALAVCDAVPGTGPAAGRGDK